jgi:hypothetical protein
MSVRVKETWPLASKGSGVAHSLQYFESAGLTVSHLGHFWVILASTTSVLD